MKLGDPWDDILARKAQDALPVVQGGRNETVWTIPATRAPTWFYLVIGAAATVALLAAFAPTKRSR